MLANRVNYTANISYLTNVFIYEYDISKANINVLFSKGLITEEIYKYLYNSERMTRQVYVGKLIKDDPNLGKALAEGIIEAKKEFFRANGIEDRDVLSIKNDAVFLINKIATITQFGLIEFGQKHVYTSFYKLNGVELYYFYNSVTKEERIDVKGIGDKKLKLHENYFLDLLKDIFYGIQVNGPAWTMRLLKDVYNDYIALKLPLEYYREFNITSAFSLNVATGTGMGFAMDSMTPYYANMMNIMYNLSILMQIQRILTIMLFSK